MFKTIVVGTDGSKGALEALGVVGELARRFDSAVHVVTACPPYTAADIAQIESQLPDEFHDLISPHMRADDRFFEAEDALRPFGISPIRHESPARAADAILDVAAEVDADLIVVGARRLGAIGRFFRGSVSTKVAHNAPCNVLIVEHDD